jgi:FdhD protein
MIDNSISVTRITKVNNGRSATLTDFLASEEPLEIALIFGQKNKREKKSISVTTRTPGNDAELALGFLFTEGILSSKKDLTGFSSSAPNTIDVELNESVLPNINKLERNFYTTSACGVCGKSSIEAIRTVAPYRNREDNITVSPGILYKLPSSLEEEQKLFEKTGGLHAAAIFDLTGKLMFYMEDVGRHNALDKVIGYGLTNDYRQLGQSILLLSGRASFELIQKAAIAGIKVVAAVGAPSTLAVELAKEFDITLVGFLRGTNFNIYCGEKRITL